MLYIDFLGTAGENNRFMRRYGIMIFSTFTPLAQALLLKLHYKKPYHSVSAVRVTRYVHHRYRQHHPRYRPAEKIPERKHRRMDFCFFIEHVFCRHDFYLA